MVLPSNQPLPNDAETLLKEVSATVKIKDLNKYFKLRDQIYFKWWESSILLLLFISALGSVVSFVRFIPQSRNVAVYYLSAFWLVLLLISVIIAIEFLIIKLRSARQLLEMLCTILDAMDKRIKKLEDSYMAAKTALPQTSDKTKK